ncbi:MarR family winged helix-turn-helix transcriptional regulator [Mumia zhuanghuii]|uniref:MarR family winged helix-turn-helix transcriptional regulator n=1 Tax=Mumia zhuanghuii TaxID=2585211 RepID=UPI0036330346
MPPIDRNDVRFQVGMQLRELLRLAPSVHARLASDIGIGITDAQALDHAMAALPDPMGVGDLAHNLGIRSASATVAVDRLVSSGHMERASHPTDKRRTSLVPTDSAYTDAARAAAPLITAIRSLTGELDDEVADQIHVFLAEAIDLLRGFADHDDTEESLGDPSSSA